MGKNSIPVASRRKILQSTATTGLIAVIGSSSVSAYNHGDDNVDYDPDTGSVSFVSPDQDANVQNPVSFEMEATDFIIEAAKNGVRDGAGHFHILVDQNPLPAGEVIPNNEENGYYHYGGGQKTAEIQLEPGEHTIYLQAGDAKHRAYTLTDSLSVTVEEAAGGKESTFTMDNVGADAWVVPSADEKYVDLSGDSNPTITLEAGVRYTVSNEGWNRHPVAFLDEEQNTLLSQEPNETGELEDNDNINWSDSGETLSFTLNKKLAEEVDTYICTVHNSMQGSLRAITDTGLFNLSVNAPSEAVAGNGVTISVDAEAAESRISAFQIAPDEQPDHVNDFSDLSVTTTAGTRIEEPDFVVYSNLQDQVTVEWTGTIPENAEAGETFTLAGDALNEAQDRQPFSHTVTVTDDPLAEYRNQNGEVDDTGLLEAISDWRDGVLEDTQLLQLISEWRGAGGNV
jgi:plastocyanin